MNIQLSQAVGIVALIAQAFPAIMAYRYGRRGKATIYLVTLPVVWFLALTLMSGHLLLAPSLLLVFYPAPWAFLLHVMKLRREELALLRPTEN